MEDELLGKYFSEKLEGDPINFDSEMSDTDRAVITQAQKLIDSISLLKQMEAIDTSKALRNVKTRSSYRKGFSYLLLVQKAAAVLLLPLLALALWQGILLHKSKNYQGVVMNSISTPPTLRSTFELPDGTKVWLNGNSSLKYPVPFSGNERLVELEGEAYFEVHSNHAHPFLVRTGNLLIEAVGTAFNIKAFAEDAKNDVLLTEGIVNILLQTEKERNVITTMSPNQLLTFNKNELNYVKRNVDPKKYISWREGKLIFSDDALPEMLLKLERWYNVEFMCDPNLNTAYAFTGSFAGDDLSKILECIELTTPVSFEFQQMTQDSAKYYTKTKINVKQKRKK